MVMRLREAYYGMTSNCHVITTPVPCIVGHVPCHGTAIAWALIAMPYCHAVATRWRPCPVPWHSRDKRMAATCHAIAMPVSSGSCAVISMAPTTHACDCQLPRHGLAWVSHVMLLETPPVGFQGGAHGDNTMTWHCLVTLRSRQCPRQDRWIAIAVQ